MEWSNKSGSSLSNIMDVYLGNKTVVSSPLLKGNNTYQWRRVENFQQDSQSYYFIQSIIRIKNATIS